MAKYLGEQLNDKIINVFNTKFLTVMLATVDDDGFPRIAPVSIFSVKDSKTILMGMQANCRSAQNIKRNGMLMLSLCEENDLAVGIKGKARMIKEMNSFKGGGIFEIEVLEVKDDSAIDVKVVKGVTLELRDSRWLKLITRAVEELDVEAGLSSSGRKL